MQKVKSGGYESASEVVRESLRLLRMVDQRHAMEGIVQEIAKEKRSKSR
jgi:putative addiction module CopG family antidote